MHATTVLMWLEIHAEMKQGRTLLEMYLQANVSRVFLTKEESQAKTPKLIDAIRFLSIHKTRKKLERKEFEHLVDFQSGRCTLFWPQETSKLYHAK